LNIVHVPAINTTGKKALLGYIPESYTLPADHPNFLGHSNFQECRTLIECLSEQGYDVDVVNWDADMRAVGKADYDLLIALDFQLEYAKTLVKSSGKVILYATGCHWSFANPAEYGRINQLKERRGVMLLPRRQSKPFSCEGKIDEIWYLGNDFTRDTYAHHRVPKHRLNISIIEFPVIEKNDFQQNHFLWFASAGAVHKGLDWLLEIFSRNSELHLHICGLVELEKDFYELYYRELHELPNIHFHGWVLPNSTQFQTILKQCSYVVSPSCSEGGGGATLQCMYAGLIPIVTRASSVDAEDCGFVSAQDTFVEVEKSIKKASLLSADELAKKSHQSREYVLNHHLLKHYKQAVLKRLQSSQCVVV